MRRPRASIAEIMAAVAVVALDCGAIHQILILEAGPQASTHWRLFVEVVLLGGLPMANLLGLVAWRARRRPGPASRGFLAVGGALTLAFVVGTAAWPMLVIFPIELLVQWIDDAFNPGRTMPIALGFVLFSGLLTLPQLLPALASAWFLGRYRLTIERRARVPVEREPQYA